MSTLPLLFSYRRCPYAIRARLALWQAGLAVQVHEVSLRDKPAELLRLSPKGTVPVLCLPDGMVLEQSLDIMRWALGQHDPEGWLQHDAGTLNDMLALIAECDGHFKQALDRCKYPNRFPDADPAQAWVQADEWLQQLESRLTSQPFLFGNHATLADMAIAPFVRQFAGIDPARWQAQPWPRLQRWLADWLGSDLLAQAMPKYPAWVEGTVGVVFPET